MARQYDAFENRLERLELLGEHRAQFDSKVRCLQADSVGLATPRKPEPEEQVARLIALMEDLAKRMDILDRKNRAMSEEFRQKDRHDRRRWKMVVGLAAVVLFLGVGGWVAARFDLPMISSMALDRSAVNPADGA